MARGLTLRVKLKTKQTHRKRSHVGEHPDLCDPTLINGEYERSRSDVGYRMEFQLIQRTYSAGRVYDLLDHREWIQYTMRMQ